MYMRSQSIQRETLELKSPSLSIYSSSWCNVQLVRTLHCIAGSVPYDGVPIEVLVSISLALTILAVLVTSTGIIFAIVCLIFNFYFRNTTLVNP